MEKGGQGERGIGWMDRLIEEGRGSGMREFGNEEFERFLHTYVHAKLSLSSRPRYPNSEIKIGREFSLFFFSKKNNITEAAMRLMPVRGGLVADVEPVSHF